jgi:hypothetical protein
MSRVEDLTVVQGTDSNFKLLMVEANGDPKDLTGKLFSASMKKTYSDATSIDFTTTVLNANAGSISLELSSDQTADLDYTIRYVYDVMMYESGNTNIENILSGKVFIKPSVTRVG